MPPLATAQFDYALPDGLIAQFPAARRDQSRLLVVDRATRQLRHLAFSDLPLFLGAGDALFRNNASVLPARLSATRPSGGKVECFLLERRPEAPGAAGELWRCLVKPGRRLPAGASFAGAGGAFDATIEAWEGDEGTALVRFTTVGEAVLDVARRQGEVPLPPYIARDGTAERGRDRERYQTVYADPARPVAVAAPTAGLHFTEQLLAALSAGGAVFHDLTLHVGLGTFRPIASEAVEGHRIHRETYEIPAATQGALFGSARRVAVGTTAVRSIEDFLAAHDAPLDRAYAGSAGIFLYPPCRFRGVDALITNFHQPRSTLLCLVAAFLAPGSVEGIAWLKEIYAEAIAHRYRFFSYGDAMLIL